MGEPDRTGDRPASGGGSAQVPGGDGRRSLRPADGSLGPSHVDAPAATLTRTYKGNPTAAAKWFERDAALLATGGYYPISQSYTPGSRGCGAFLIALLLAIVLIGILIFIYLIVVKPPGTLLVAYQWTPPVEAPTSEGGA